MKLQAVAIRTLAGIDEVGTGAALSAWIQDVLLPHVPPDPTRATDPRVHALVEALSQCTLNPQSARRGLQITFL